MGKFITYTVIGTLATFAILVHLSLLPHLLRLPAFAGGVSPEAVLGEYKPLLLTLVLSWIVWWGVSGLCSLVLYAIGKFSGIALFLLSLVTVFGITKLIN